MMWSSLANTLSTGIVMLLEVDLAPAELELALHELVVLVEVLEPLLGGLARMVRAVGDPLLHAQEVQELLLVVHDLEHVEVVLRQRAHRRHHREHRAHELARQVAVRLDQAVDVLRASRLRVHRLMKPWPRRSSLLSAWKSTGVMVRTRFLTVSGWSAA